MKDKIYVSKKILEGVACGDAMGKIASKYNKSDLRNIYGGLISDIVKPIRNKSWRTWEKGDITDDTLLTLMVADSLIEKGRFDRQDICRRFIECPDTKGGTQILKLKEKSSLDYVANDGDTNGASIRIGALAIKYHNSDSLFDNVISLSNLTHGGNNALLSALTLSSIYRDIIKGYSRNEIISKLPQEVEKLDCIVPGNKFASSLEKGLVYTINLSGCDLVDELEKNIGLEKYSWSSVVSAIIVGLNYKDSKKCVLDCVNRNLKGGDLDSFTSIAAAISYGLSNNDNMSDWVSVIEKRNSYDFNSYARRLLN